MVPGYGMTRPWELDRTPTQGDPEQAVKKKRVSPTATPKPSWRHLQPPPSPSQKSKPVVLLHCSCVLTFPLL